MALRGASKGFGAECEQSEPNFTQGGIKVPPTSTTKTLIPKRWGCASEALPAECLIYN